MSKKYQGEYALFGGLWAITTILSIIGNIVWYLQITWGLITFLFFIAHFRQRRKQREDTDG